MSRKSNIAGMRFGHLVAVNPTEQRKNNYTVWRCLCDCGHVALCSSRDLKQGRTQSCDSPDCQYFQSYRKMRGRYEDLTGQRFGKLTVKSLADKDASGIIRWNCICDCGGSITVPAGQLKGGYRKSCGCLSRHPLKNWVGKKFGKLTVISYEGKKGGKHYWKCACECGNEVTVCQSNLKNGHTISCGCMNTPYAARTLVDGTCIESLRGAIEKKTVSKNNSSGIRGVYKNKRTNRWCAQITFKGKTKYLGSFDTLREAQDARLRGEEIFEEFLASYDAENGFSGKAEYPAMSSGETAQQKELQQIWYKEPLRETV